MIQLSLLHAKAGAQFWQLFLQTKFLVWFLVYLRELESLGDSWQISWAQMCFEVVAFFVSSLLQISLTLPNYVRKSILTLLSLFLETFHALIFLFSRTFLKASTAGGTREHFTVRVCEITFSTNQILGQIQAISKLRGKRQSLTQPRGLRIAKSLKTFNPKVPALKRVWVLLDLTCK